MYENSPYPHVSNFYSNLRSYEPTKVTRKNDYLKYTQTFVKKEYISVLQEKTRNQRALSARLSRPKSSYGSNMNSYR
jgi:hypothetical protein